MSAPGYHPRALATDELGALEIRVGTIVGAEVLRGARRPAYALSIDFGDLGRRPSSAEIADLNGNPWIVRSPTLENYRDLLTNGNYVLHFRNSVIVTICVVAITMVISTLAAFALARMRFWGSTLLATGVFLTYLVPETLLKRRLEFLRSEYDRQHAPRSPR